MTPILWAFAALLAPTFVVALFVLAQRLAGPWLVPAHKALAVPAALIAAATLLLIDTTLGLEPVLSALDPHDKVGSVGFARTGPSAALTLLLLSLAAFLIVYLGIRLAFAITRPRDPNRSPVPTWMRALGIAPDGRPIRSVQRPLFWSATLVLAALLIASALTPLDAPPSLGWAFSALALTGWVIALSPGSAAHTLALTPTRAASPASPTTKPTTDATLAAWHLACGAPTLIAHEPATRLALAADGLWLHQRHALAACHPTSALAPPTLAIGGPSGSGKRTAALLIASELAAIAARRVIWVGETPASDLLARLAVLRPDETSLIAIEVIAPSSPTLDAAARWDDPPAVIIVECDLARSGVILARLRYAAHRLAGQRQRVPMIVIGALGRDSLMTAARAIAAAEPTFIEATQTPTAAIDRYLLERPAPSTPTPQGASLVAIDAPRPHPRYPTWLEKRPIHELIRLPGGPRGRRVRAWLDDQDPRLGSDIATRQRLVIALPGDREVPELRLRSARLALHRSLADGWQDERRLIEVFSKRLVKAELAALSDKGLERRHRDSRSEVRCPNAPAHETESLDLELRDPRTNFALSIPREVAELEAFEGAIFGRYEVTLGVDGDRLLVPTTSLRSTPLRRLRLSQASKISTVETIHHHRFRGDATLEVRATRLSLAAVHHGVRRFESAEHRAHTTLVHAPRMVAPRTVEAVVLAFPNASEAGLHALSHALSEMLPWVVDNATDLGITHEGECSKSTIVLWDRHPDGLGAVHDLRGNDLLALLTEAHNLLASCDCQAHCAQCCESTSCTTPEAPLDRHAALSLITPLLEKRPRPQHALLRSTA